MIYLQSGMAIGIIMLLIGNLMLRKKYRGTFRRNPISLQILGFIALVRIGGRYVDLEQIWIEEITLGLLLASAFLLLIEWKAFQAFKKQEEM